MTGAPISQDSTAASMSGPPAGKPLDVSKTAPLYDFRRPDRIAKDQLHSIHVLHENFARCLASSLSAFLRANVAVDLISVEQLPFAEFTRRLPSPTCIVELALHPLEGSAILELSQSLAFPIFEMLLGGNGKGSAKISREITEIEKSILDGLFRIMLQDLRTAWQAVGSIDFTVESHATDPAQLRMLAASEAVVSIRMELRVGEYSGFINIAIPSVIIKMLIQKFDQQWTARKTASSEADQARVLKLIRPAMVNVEARMNGPKVLLGDLLAVEAGDVLTFDYSIKREVDCITNGCIKFQGNIVQQGNKRAFRVNHEYRPSE
jgi:flagellar motor switch protein FliM